MLYTTCAAPCSVTSMLVRCFPEKHSGILSKFSVQVDAHICYWHTSVPPPLHGACPMDLNASFLAATLLPCNAVQILLHGCEVWECRTLGFLCPSDVKSTIGFL
uniref:Uncharacterized protein n=1 Tax=Opuntia streptacantha TaxID=393608 RepID=A0A7C8ZFK2_OPUST